eukprot:m.303548 g.303548  ORF g.303548 m.303548 type:complete len:776 (+) comp16435_c0_seq100:243-2570(+)
MESCARCGDTVYRKEEVRLDGASYHSSCFSCQNCNRMLTLQTFYKSPHARLTKTLFCKKCGPTIAPTVTTDGVDFQRAQMLKGGRLVNNQIRRVGTKAKERNLVIKNTDDDSDGEIDIDECYEEEIDLDTALMEDTSPHQQDPQSPLPGAEPKGYHASGFPIYGNLAGYYNALSEDGGQEPPNKQPPPIPDAEPTYNMPTPVEEDPEFNAQAENKMKYSEEMVYEYPNQERQDGNEWTADQAAANKAEISQISARHSKDIKDGLADKNPMKAFGDPLKNENVYDAPHPDSLSDRDYGQPCLTCQSCPGWIMHRWRKVCQTCRCPRINHRSREITERRKLLEEGKLDTYKKEFSWTPAGCDDDAITDFFACIPSECIPKVGTDGEIWRQQQLLIQLPAYDTDPDKCSSLTAGEIRAHKKLDEIRLKKAFDVGQAMRCPDFSKPGECRECKLREDGTHWAWCSKFVEPDLTERLKAAGIKSKKPSSRRRSSHQEIADAVQGNFQSNGSERSIKLMKKSSVSSESSVKDQGITLSLEEGGLDQSTSQNDKIPSGGKQASIFSCAIVILLPGKCHGCMEELCVGEMVVSVGRFSEEDETYFHPKCFACSQCGELLVDLRAFVDIGREERGQVLPEKRLFCGRHWSENHVNRCYGCDELILQREHVYECGHPYHIRHFTCHICDSNLTQLDTFVPRGRKPYCFPCYGKTFADTCTACNSAINPAPGHGGKVTIGTNHWHGECYKCKICQTNLDGKPAIPRGKDIYCKPCLKTLLKSSRRS